MGRLKTREDLEKMFKESRERQKLKKQEAKLKKQQEEKTKTLPPNVLNLLNKIQEAKEKKYKQIEALGGIRRKKVDNVSPTPMKSAQRGLKQARVWHNPLTERNSNECDLYLTREELQEAEERGEGKINWDKWDKHIEERLSIIKNDFSQ